MKYFLNQQIFHANFIHQIEDRIQKIEKKIDDLSDEDSGDDSGGAGEEKCPPKPATITPFNATKVSDF